MHALRAAAAAAAATALLATSAAAHMALSHPPPFNATNNPHRTTPADPYLEYPYDCCGEDDRWEYPCRGYHKLLGTPQGAPTATWEAGSSQTWNISGAGNHFGGSCQVGFSTDNGQTFRVATSYEGNCPHRNNGNGPSGQDFNFTVPPDIKAGVHIFAWMWYNREQEFNMNCAAVNITTPAPPPYALPLSPPTLSTYASASRSTTTIRPDPYCQTCFCKICSCEAPGNCSCRETVCAGTTETPPREIAFNHRPLMFVADDGNDCLTPHTTAELRYPDPGFEVVRGDGAYPLELPTGGCGPEEMLSKQAYTGANGNDGHN